MAKSRIIYKRSDDSGGSSDSSGGGGSGTISVNPKTGEADPTSTYRISQAEYEASQQGKIQEGSSYPQIQAAVDGGGSGSYTLDDGTKVQVEAGTSYKDVEAERQQLVEKAAAEGTATEQQYKEAYRPDLRENQQFKEYSQTVKQYETGLKRQGIQNAGEFFAAVKGEPSPRQSSYSEVEAERKRLLELYQRAPTPPAGLGNPPKTGYITDQYYYSPTGEIWTLGKREKAVIAAAEKVEQLEQERADRYQSFSNRIANQNIVFRGAQKVGYAVGVGWGEALAGAAAKTFIYVGAATSPILRSYAAEGSKEAVKDAANVLAYEYDPRTLRGWGNIALTATAIFALGRYRAGQRAKAKLKVAGEPLPKDSVMKKFNVKDKDISSTKIETTTTKQQTAQSQKVGDQKTTIQSDSGKTLASKKTGEVLTERGSTTTPAKRASLGLPENPKAKVQITYAEQGGQGITTTTKSGWLYNYERVTTQVSRPLQQTSPLGYKYNTPQSYSVSQYFKINKLTGGRTYLGSTQQPFKPDIIPIEPKVGTPKTTGFEREGGAALRQTQRTTSSAASKTNAGLKIDSITTTKVETAAASVPSQAPASTKTPPAAASTKITTTRLTQDVTPTSTRVRITTDPKPVQQPSQSVIVKPSSVTTKTPAIIDTKSVVTQSTTSRLSFGNKNIVGVVDSPNYRIVRYLAPNDPSLVTIKLRPDQATTSRLATIKIQPETTTATRTITAPNVADIPPPPPLQVQIPANTPIKTSAPFQPVLSPAPATAETITLEPTREPAPVPAPPRSINEGATRSKIIGGLESVQEKRATQQPRPKSLLENANSLNLEREARGETSPILRGILAPKIQQDIDQQQNLDLITEPTTNTRPRSTPATTPRLPRAPEPPQPPTPIIGGFALPKFDIEARPKELSRSRSKRQSFGIIESVKTQKEPTFILGKRSVITTSGILKEDKKKKRKEDLRNPWGF